MDAFNMGRSQVAVAIARGMGYEALSGGLTPNVGDRVSDQAIRAMKTRDVATIPQERAKEVDKKILEDPTYLIVGMRGWGLYETENGPLRKTRVMQDSKGFCDLYFGHTFLQLI